MKGLGQFRSFPVEFSIDTRHAANGGKSPGLGADWINDVTGFSSAAMVRAVAGSKCRIVVMHSLGVPANPSVVMPENEDVVETILRFARSRINELQEAGIAHSRIIFDPGIGFGKTKEQSQAIIDGMARFTSLGVPLLVGHSRKSFLVFSDRRSEEGRDNATLSVSERLAGIADYLRVAQCRAASPPHRFARSRHRMTDAIEAFLNQLHHPLLAGIDLKLERMRRLLLMLGSPEKRLPPVIHVAGTNGKGSLLAYLQAIFEAAGKRVHRYTSPHLVHFNERIILQGKPVDNGYLENVLRHILPALQSQPATFFEATTVAAFVAYAERPADVLLLETGMGGRLDSTNVVDKPLLTAITPVSLDHCNFLGNTIAAIAGEKAGIIKPGVPCVVGPQLQEASDVIAAQAEKMSAPLYRHGTDWRWREENNQPVYESSERTLAFSPGLAGKYQYGNAAAAIACVEKLPQFNFSNAEILSGLQNAVWPARLQPLTRGAYVDMLPPGIKLWLDGGHNPAGGQVLADWLKDQQGEIYLVCGMIRDKDSVAYLKPMAPHVKELYAIDIPREAQSKPAAQVEKAAKDAGIVAFTAPSPEKALQTIAGRAKTPALIVICGSLYLAGKVLAVNNRSSMQDIIDRAWEERTVLGTHTKGEIRDAVDTALLQLDAGDIRIAEKKSNEWVVNQWMKKAVLLSFRLNDMEVMEGGALGWYDKVPSKVSGWDAARFKKAGFRAVPGAIVRRGAFYRPGCRADAFFCEYRRACGRRAPWSTHGRLSAVVPRSASIAISPAAWASAACLSPCRPIPSSSKITASSARARKSPRVSSSRKARSFQWACSSAHRPRSSSAKPATSPMAACPPIPWWFPARCPAKPRRPRGCTAPSSSSASMRKPAARPASTNCCAALNNRL